MKPHGVEVNNYLERRTSCFFLILENGATFLMLFRSSFSLGVFVKTVDSFV